MIDITKLKAEDVALMGDLTKTPKAVLELLARELWAEAELLYCYISEYETFENRMEAEYKEMERLQSLSELIEQMAKGK